MAEWLKAHAWKACLGETLTWVRIPLSPPVPHSQIGVILTVFGGKLLGKPADKLAPFAEQLRRHSSDVIAYLTRPSVDPDEWTEPFTAWMRSRCAVDTYSRKSAAKRGNAHLPGPESNRRAAASRLAGCSVHRPLIIT
jgi:hypothetical protein